MRRLVTAGLVLATLAIAAWLGDRVRGWNDELALPSPPVVRLPERGDDPKTPRLAGRVVVVVIDGLGIDEAEKPQLSYLHALGRSGVAATARVPYPTISRPNYVTILTGVPPRDSGVRVNRVQAPVAVDTVMDRVRAAGLRVATASDFGMMASLFLRNTPSITGIDWVERGTQVSPPPPIGWPFDDARRTGSLTELRPVIAELAAGDAALVAVLVLDVDRAGHASGVGDEYRAAAAEVDRTLRGAFAGIDFARDAVIVTADHGHVAPGGHGGDEREVSTVPLLLAGSGIVAGATPRDARLIDIAPTIAALLGVPAPRQAEGRALVEILRLSPGEASRRAAIDDARARAVVATADAARAEVVRPVPARLALVAGGLAIAIALGFLAHRRGAIALVIAPSGCARAFAGALGFAVVLAAIAVLTRGHLSPSYVPALARTEVRGAIGVAIALALQLGASWWVVRRAQDRLAAANGIALASTALALAIVELVRAWFSPPYLDVPSPFWMVVVPTVDLAGATCALGNAALLALALARQRVIGAQRGARGRPAMERVALSRAEP